MTMGPAGRSLRADSESRNKRSYDLPAYDNGTKKNQLMLAGDVIYFFWEWAMSVTAIYQR